MIAAINELVNLQPAVVQRMTLPVTSHKQITADVLRIDKIHATISGNKWFKLQYALEDAMLQGKKNIITFGGAYSNHLLATAYACARLGLHATGIIRGERPEILSGTLQECSGLGMQLHFVSRDDYHEKERLHGQLMELFPGSYIIPEGGAGARGVRGAAEILQLTRGHDFSHICCAVGTGTMLAGLLTVLSPEQSATGVSALKIPAGDNTISRFIQETTGSQNYSITYDYHFGGYARKTAELIQFMNSFYTQTGIPTDFVYTAKLFYGIIDMIGKDQFPPGSHLMIIHSGGLQGNRSLPKNSLVF